MKAHKGDKIRITNIQMNDSKGRLRVGDIYEVAIACNDGDIYIDMNGDLPLWLVAEEYEVISEESK